MQPHLRRCCAAIVAAVAVGPALAVAPAHYEARFAMTPRNLAVLKTGIPNFDGDRHFTGAWESWGLQDARTLTTDLASFSTGPDGQSFIPTWGATDTTRTADAAATALTRLVSPLLLRTGRPAIRARTLLPLQEYSVSR